MTTEKEKKRYTCCTLSVHWWRVDAFKINIWISDILLNLRWNSVAVVFSSCLTDLCFHTAKGRQRW